MKIVAPIGKNKMKILLGTLIGFIILDGLLTEFLLSQGMAREINPFLQPLVGDIGFMVLKVVGALLVAFILWDVYRRFPKAAVITTWVAVAGYGGIVLWNASLCLLL